jgi:hypothetical protein
MQKLEFDEKKFPHLTNVKDSAEQLTQYIEKLNKRKLIIATQNNDKSDFEKNEDEILLIKTDWELGKSHKNLAEKTDYITNFTQKLVEYIAEVNENYEAMIEKTNTFYNNNRTAKNNEQIKAIEVQMEKVKDVDLNENWEVRITHYIVLRTIFENPTKKK